MYRLNLLFGLLALASVFALSAEVAAQRKIITSKEYYDGAPKFYEYFKKSRHVEKTEETLTDGIVAKASLLINEVLLPDRSVSIQK